MSASCVCVCVCVNLIVLLSFIASSPSRLVVLPLAGSLSVVWCRVLMTAVMVVVSPSSRYEHRPRGSY